MTPRLTKFNMDIKLIESFSPYKGSWPWLVEHLQNGWKLFLAFLSNSGYKADNNPF